mgnify:FL=1
MDTDSFDAGELSSDQETAADGGIAAEEVEDIKQQAKREAMIENVIRRYRPWDDGSGDSYQSIADDIDYSREWVRNRVREWREEYEHRDLVQDPTAK